MIISWPFTLPQKPYYRFSNNQLNGLLSPEEIIYPSRNRTNPDFSGSYLFKRLTKEQFQIFRSWWDNEINQCAPFTAPWLEMLGYPNCVCRFDPEEPWELSLEGNMLSLSINVELVTTVPIVNGSISY